MCEVARPNLSLLSTTSDAGAASRTRAPITNTSARKAGVEVLYCAEQFENDGSLASTVLKSIKRTMAGEYSRELSMKVFVGQSREVRRGFFQGGTAGFGLRRLVIDENSAAKALLEHEQRKSLQTDRIILVPGPRSEVNIIGRIFTPLAIKKKSRTQIAAELKPNKSAMTVSPAMARSVSDGIPARRWRSERSDTRKLTLRWQSEWTSAMLRCRITICSRRAICRYEGSQETPCIGSRFCRFPVPKPRCGFERPG